eukprot:GSChrysophyteH1.ASY1.ANO1.1457.1 assembled CDS
MSDQITISGDKIGNDAALKKIDGKISTQDESNRHISSDLHVSNASLLKNGKDVDDKSKDADNPLSGELTRSLLQPPHSTLALSTGTGLVSSVPSHKMLATCMEPQIYTLMVHSVTRSTEDVIFSPDLIRDWYLSHDNNSNLRDSLYVQVLSEAQAHDETSIQQRDRLVLRVPRPDRAGSGVDDHQEDSRLRLEISISSAIADAFGLVPFGRVLVLAIPPEEVEMNFMELVFKRQFLQRGNIWRFNKSTIGRTVFVGQTISVDGVQATIQELACKGIAARSGMISNNTQVIFRSRSTRIVWLVQISSEMWEYDQAGDLYYEKFLNKFVGPLLDRWNALSVSHSLSVVFFSRTLFANGDATSAAHGSVENDNGVFYQDFFKVVIENNLEIDKTKIIKTLKQEFWEFPRLLKWKLGRAGPSDAASGNTLEAINTTLNLLDKHHMDRDLVRTGNSIIMLSASTAFFRVNPWMVQITKQRMMDSGIGLDFVSLSQPPLHVVPLFLDSTASASVDVKDFYEVPHWMSVSYIDCKQQNSLFFLPPTSNQGNRSHRNISIGSRNHSRGVGAFNSGVGRSYASTALEFDAIRNDTDTRGLGSHLNTGDSKAEIDSADKSEGVSLLDKSESNYADVSGRTSMDLASGSGFKKDSVNDGIDVYSTSEIVLDEPVVEVFSTLPFSNQISGFVELNRFKIAAEVQRNFRRQMPLYAQSTPRSPDVVSVLLDKGLPTALRALLLKIAIEKIALAEQIGSSTPFEEKDRLGPKQQNKIPISEWGHLNFRNYNTNMLELVKDTARSSAKLAAAYLVKRQRKRSVSSLVTATNETDGLNTAASPVELCYSILSNVIDSIVDESDKSFNAAISEKVLSTKNSSSAFSGSGLSQDILQMRLEPNYLALARKIYMLIQYSGRNKVIQNAEKINAFAKSTPFVPRLESSPKDGNKNTHSASSLTQSSSVKVISNTNGISGSNSKLNNRALYNSNVSPSRDSRMVGSYERVVSDKSKRNIGSSFESSSTDQSRESLSANRQPFSVPHDIINTSRNSSPSHNWEDSEINSNVMIFLLAQNRDAVDYRYQISGSLPNEGGLTALGGGGDTKLEPGTGSTGTGLNGSDYMKQQARKMTRTKIRNSRVDLDFLVHEYDDSIFSAKSLYDAGLRQNRSSDAVMGASNTFMAKKKGNENEDNSKIATKKKKQKRGRLRTNSNITSVSIDEEDNYRSRSRSLDLNGVTDFEDKQTSGQKRRQSNSKASKMVPKKAGVSQASLMMRKPVSPSRDYSRVRTLSAGSYQPNRSQAMAGSFNSEFHHSSSPTSVNEMDSPQLSQILPGAAQGVAEGLTQYAINPFKFDESESSMQARMHNRRRWSHVFPKQWQKNIESRNSSTRGSNNSTYNSNISGGNNYFGLNWKSLCQPAILPITTDYVPKVADLVNNYNIQTNYDLILDPKEGPFVTPDSLVEEMVCQRLSQEFQLVEDKDFDAAPYLHYVKNVSGKNTSNYGTVWEETAKLDDVIFHILSMGHRVQFIMFDPSNMQVRVIQLVSKKLAKYSTALYDYSIYVAQTRRFQVVRQQFWQFPSDFFWNKVDNILFGASRFDIGGSDGHRYGDEIRAKRLRFAVLPDIASTDKDVKDYLGKIEKLLQLFRDRLFKGEVINVKMDASLKPVVATQEESSEGSKEGITATSVPAHTTIGATVIPARAPRQKQVQARAHTVPIWLRAPLASDLGHNSKDILRDHNQKSSRPEWAFLKYDASVSVHRVFLIELHWLVCDSWVMDKLVSLLFRRCSSWQLKLAQIPEYFMSANLQLHPYRGQPYLAVPKTTSMPPVIRHKYKLDQVLGGNEKESYGIILENPAYPSAVDLVERLFLRVRGKAWIEDEARRTNWSELGLTNPDYRHRISNTYSNVTSDATANSGAPIGPETALSIIPTSVTGDTSITKTIMEGKEGSTIGAILSAPMSFLAKTIAGDGDEEMGQRDATSQRVTAPQKSVPVKPTLHRTLHQQHRGRYQQISVPPSRSIRPMSAGFGPLKRASSFHSGTSPGDLSRNSRQSFGGITASVNENNVSVSIRRAEMLRQRVQTSGGQARLDRQYMHREGIACVRVAAHGFVWLLNSGVRVATIGGPKQESREIPKAPRGPSRNDGKEERRGLTSSKDFVSSSNEKDSGVTENKAAEKKSEKSPLHEASQSITTKNGTVINIRERRSSSNQATVQAMAAAAAEAEKQAHHEGKGSGPLSDAQKSSLTKAFTRIESDRAAAFGRMESFGSIIPPDEKFDAQTPEGRRELAFRALKELESFCISVGNCYDILVEIFESAMNEALDQAGRARQI